MKRKTLLAVIVLAVFGAGAWGAAWLCLHPAAPWPRVDCRDKPEPELGMAFDGGPRK